MLGVALATVVATAFVLTSTPGGAGPDVSTVAVPPGMDGGGTGATPPGPAVSGPTAAASPGVGSPSAAVPGARGIPGAGTPGGSARPRWGAAPSARALGPAVAEHLPSGSPAPVAGGAATPPSSGLRLVIPVEPSEAAGRTRAQVDADLDRVVAAGATGVRVVADMNWLCPSATCDFGPVAPVVTGARSRGLDVFFHINSMPNWLDGRGRWYGPTGATGRAYAGLVAQLTRRFSTSVSGYEIWNEPNIDAFWAQGSDPAQYADLLKSVWTAVKKDEPQVQLVAGALSNNDLGWMRALDRELAALGGNAQNRYYYDLLGVHPYTGDASSGYDPMLPAGSKVVHVATGAKDMTFQGVTRLRQQVAQDEGIWRDVVIGEFGYTTRSGWYHAPETRRQQYFASAMQIAARWPWLRAFTVYSYATDDQDGFSVLGTRSESVLRVAR